MSSSIFGNRCLDYQRQAQGVEKQTTLVVGDAPEPSERRELQNPQTTQANRKFWMNFAKSSTDPPGVAPRHKTATLAQLPTGTWFGGSK